MNEPEYCGKYLWIEPGAQCSLHYHPNKKETFIVLQGRVELEVESHYNMLEPNSSAVLHLGVGDSYTIEPGVAHRFKAIPYVESKYVAVEVKGAALVLEISTHHEDADVVRLEPSRLLSNLREEKEETNRVGS